MAEKISITVQVLTILDAFYSITGPILTGDLAEIVDLPKGTVRRRLLEMEAEGWVVNHSIGNADFWALSDRAYLHEHKSLLDHTRTVLIEINKALEKLNRAEAVAVNITANCDIDDWVEKTFIPSSYPGKSDNAAPPDLKLPHHDKPQPPDNILVDEAHPPKAAPRTGADARGETDET